LANQKPCYTNLLQQWKVGFAETKPKLLSHSFKAADLSK